MKDTTHVENDIFQIHLRFLWSVWHKSCLTDDKTFSIYHGFSFHNLALKG